MVKFPQPLNRVLEICAKENGAKLLRNTHYNAVNVELVFYLGDSVRRLNCELVESRVHVFLYIETFPCFPVVLRWCQNNIPMFPSLAKRQWKKVAELPDTEADDYYSARIAAFVRFLQVSSPETFGEKGSGERV